MNTTVFDRHEYIKRWKAKGMSEELAEDITDAIAVAKDTDASHLATKADLAELKAELIKWFIGISFAQVAMILSILKLH